MRPTSYITQITPQQHRQLADRFQQIPVDHNVPLVILVEAVQRVLTITLLIFTDPRRTMSTADTAHGVEGFVGADGGHTGRNCSSGQARMMVEPPKAA